MKRLHVHVAVNDLDTSIRFYSRLFGAQPSVRKHDYAKWMLQDPRVNFAISQRRGEPGVEHLGIQVQDPGELAQVYARLKRAEGRLIEQGAITGCYAQSERGWVEDPQGIRWKVFLTVGDSTVYGTAQIRSTQEQAKAEASCCTLRPLSPERCPGLSV